MQNVTPIVVVALALELAPAVWHRIEALLAALRSAGTLRLRSGQAPESAVPTEATYTATSGVASSRLRV
jgi:hypothetical protein